MEVQYAEETAAQIGTASERTSRGHEEVLGVLSSRHTIQLYRIAYSVLGSREEAEDAVQDGLLSAVQNLKSFEGRAKLSTWLTRVVINAALMRRRKMRGYTSVSIDQTPPDGQGVSLAAKIADPCRDPEQSYARKEQLTIVNHCLTTLPASYRSAVWLRDIQGMTTEEAAEALQVSEGTLKSRLHRGRVELLRRVHEAAPARVHVNRTGRRGCATRPK
ncbi:MAG TPA: sigma-70 family RNA polymerase sigma factor [Terriglobia bacterium]|nr:sigma-70 family RNA polymerase sigma factor [Terriglobia bacterium]